MKKSDLERRFAALETERDHLETEIGNVDQLLKAVGFAGGLETLKLAAKEAIDEGLV